MNSFIPMVFSKYHIERRILIAVTEGEQYFFQSKYFLGCVAHFLSKEGTTWWEDRISSCWGQMDSAYGFIHSEHGG